MIVKIKFSIISTFLVLAFLTSSVNGSVDTNIHRSLALQTIFNQADTTYTQRLIKGMSNQVALNEHPEIFALCIGMALQRQFEYLRNNGDYIPRYEVLEEEALTFMHQLAKAHNYRHPTDGSSFLEARMGVAFYKGLNGGMNALFIQNAGIDPTNVGLPFMLDQVPAPKNTDWDDGWVGRLQVKKENEINLLGEVAPPTGKSNSPYVGKPPDIKNSRPEPEVQKQPIRRGAILGRWQFTGFDCWSSIPDDEYNVVDFRRGSGKYLYIGKNSGDESTYTVVSETQIDQYIIEYVAFWKRSGLTYGCESDREIIITVSRDKKNELHLCRDDCGRIVASGFIKIGN